MEDTEQLEKNRQFYDALRDRDYESAKKIINQIDKDYLSWVFNLHLSIKSIWELRNVIDVIELFLENGADPNRGSEFYHQKTVLHFAVDALQIRSFNSKHIETAISLLLDYGANPNQECLTCTRSTPWSDLISKNVMLVKKFLEKGADSSYHIIQYESLRAEFREQIVPYRLSVLYNQKLEARKKADQRLKELVYDKLFYRTGGMIKSF